MERQIGQGSTHYRERERECVPTTIEQSIVHFQLQKGTNPPYLGVIERLLIDRSSAEFLWSILV